MPKRKRVPRRLTDQQRQFVDALKATMNEKGRLPTAQECHAAAAAAYECGHEATARVMANKNLKKPHVIEELGLNAAGKKIFMETLFNMMQGTDPDHTKDKELKMTAMRIAARHFVPNQENVHVDDERFRDKSAEELEHYAEHGYFPGDTAGLPVQAAGNA